MAKVHESKGRYIFHCPACASAHAFDTVAPVRRWVFNGDVNRPTFSPSLLIRMHDKSVCHLNMVDGQLQYLPDSTHALAGRTIPVPEWGAADAYVIPAL